MSSFHISNFLTEMNVLVSLYFFIILNSCNNSYQLETNKQRRTFSFIWMIYMYHLYDIRSQFYRLPVKILMYQIEL